MAFDAAAPIYKAAGRVAPAVEEPAFPVAAGGYISLVNRAGLTIGYAAFGMGLGSAAALLLGKRAPEMLTLLAGAPVLVALVLAVVCAGLVGTSATPLLLVAVAAGLMAPASVFLFGAGAGLDIWAVVFVGALLVTSMLYCQRFIAAFSVAMLGLVLAAPMGAAAVTSMFAR